nr:ATP-binding protein [Streptomyces sp. GESEQ-4]
MESGAATRGTKTRAKGGQSLSNQRKPRGGTTAVDTASLDRLLAALVSMRDGNFRKRLTVSGDGVMSEIAAVFNEVADRNLHLTGELSRVRRMVGREGKLTERLESGPCEGSWAAAIDHSNALVDDLVRPVSEVGRVLSAVAEGDLSPRMELRTQAPDGTTGQPLRGEFLKVGRTVNNLVDQLSIFTDEVTRVASEVGTEGKLGGQAQVRGMSGSWKDLTDSVNTMAYRLTAQVRDIALVTTAVAKGDLSRKVTVHVAGEMLELKNTVNTMVDQLSSFSSEVTRVAREVGTEGQLGGQARVRDVDGTWRDLTESVNEMAGNLTRQVRAIARVATAVTRGDLNLKIDVDASGEIQELQDYINKMIANLRDTTIANKEQDWLKGNLARISALMQGRRDLDDVASLIMSELTPVVSAQHGAFFLAMPLLDGKDISGDQEDAYELRMLGSYGYSMGSMPTSFRPGEALIGTAAQEKRTILVENAPSGYLKISSGLGEAPPAQVIVLPVLFEGKVLGVIELASFTPFTQIQKDFLNQIAEMIATSVNTISVNTKTEVLLRQSQELTEQLRERSAELENRQKALQESNAQLEEKAELLAQQNRDIEVKNTEIEEARQVLEERAEQLAVSMRYKSEFLANMSHELRTPLNSLLILAKLLADNADSNLTPKQVEFAETIHGAGSDLLQLINDILDLSKVEAGKMDVSPTRIALVQLVDYVEATFRPLTAEKGLDLSVRVSPELPATLHTDEQRLLQVLRNLLSNAVKFTDSGSVELVIRPAGADVPLAIREQLLETGSLRDADADLIAFSVTDTGIGIAASKMRVIFEAFKQADGTTSRKYGGTGLGLSISREIAQLLGGEIHAQSEPGRGSTFTLYLPLHPSELPPQGYHQGLPVLEAGDLVASASRAAADLSELSEVEVETPAEVRSYRETQNGAAALFRRRRRTTPIAAAEQPGQERWPADDQDTAPRSHRGIRFGGQKVLIVDDDIRNVFALTSVLEQHGLSVLYAENGREGIEVLEQHDDAAVVLMDIMMPEMDGYATTTAIRRMPQFAGLPIIALTAKAMKGDREKAIESGASDYVTKPVDPDHLLAVMQQWMREE